MSSPKPAEKADKKKKTRKASGAAKKVPYAELIKEAIKAVGKPVKGASRAAIKAYIETHHKKDLHKNWTSTLRTVIRKLHASGKLVQTKGSFRISKTEAAASKKKGKKKAKKAKKSTKKATKKKGAKKTGGKKKMGTKKRSSAKKAKSTGTKKRAGAAKKGRKASRAKNVAEKRAASPAPAS